MKRFVFIAAVGLLAAACNTESLTPGVDARHISIEASIGELTKVATTGYTSVFETGDQVSLFAWTGSASSVSDTRVVNGVTNTLGADGAWTPASPMLWADMLSPHYFLGISPARAVSSFTADAYTLNAGDYEASDLLIATNLAGLSPSSTPVTLTFSHVLARLDVKLVFRDQWASAPTVSSVVVSACTTGTVDYLAGKLTSTGTAADVPLGSIDNATWSGLQVPQSGVNTITIRIEGKDYVFTHPTDIPLVSGKYTTVNLNVGRDKIELASSITIDDWVSQGTALSGDARDE